MLPMRQRAWRLRRRQTKLPAGGNRPHRHRWLSEGKEGRAEEGEWADGYGPVLFLLLTVDESNADGNNNDDEGEAAAEMKKSQARDGEVILVNPNAFDAASEEDGGGAGSEGGGHGRKRGRYGDRQTGCGNGKTLYCTYIILSRTLVFRGNVRVLIYTMYIPIPKSLFHCAYIYYRSLFFFFR